jgi:hypothetical protein
MPRTLLMLLVVGFVQDNKKSFFDPEKAGPDAAVQGEYEGSSWGAQVVALGDGKFDVYVLSGGLPGAGWNRKTRTKVPARTENGKTLFEGPGWTGEIAQDRLTAKGPEATLEMKKVLRKSSTEGAKPPEGAIVLFDGRSADGWQGGKVGEGGVLLMGTESKRKFRDFKLHIEFRLSFMPSARGQGRSNSGVYMGGRHEIQVLDSFGLAGENNECGGIYGFHKPAVNMCFPPLSWQTYDAEYTMARYDAEGKKTANARITVYHNGVKVHENVEIPKTTTAGQPEANAPGPVMLQNHGDPVMFRNIWVVETTP